MSDILTSYDRAVHSDFLIHWTGKDIDAAHKPDWYHDHYSQTKLVTDAYLQRLHDILVYGLWMTVEPTREFNIGQTRVTIPETPQSCFTELRLSESRRHALRYGRLGIGVKRPFLFERFGRPMAYFGYKESHTNDRLVEACCRNLKDQRLLNFFKPMNEEIRDLNYQLYAESEWRILGIEELVASGKIVDPRDIKCAKYLDYFSTLQPEQQDKLRYLVPLDGWFSMIIYPSLAVKNSAQWNADYRILAEIEAIKSSPKDRANQVEGRRHGGAPGHWPIELDLDACRHF